MFEEHSSSFSSPYLYNGKELDRETGLYYYGARYYDPKVSIFVNVDPLVEKYPSWTPYHYVHNNPMNLIDPTGMEAEGGGWFSKAWSSIKNTFSSSSKTEDMTVLDEIMISVKGQTQEERVRDKQIDIVTSEIKQQQQIQEWTNLGIWDPNISYDNWGHAVGSQLGLAMPTARFEGLFGLFSRTLPSEKQLLLAANSVDKGGYSAAGRALIKHGSRTETVFPKASGSRESINAQGEKVLLNIIKGPGVCINTTYSHRHGNIIEYIATNGQGVRFSLDGQKFIGFLEPFN